MVKKEKGKKAHEPSALVLRQSPLLVKNIENFFIFRFTCYNLIQLAAISKRFKLEGYNFHKRIRAISRHGETLPPFRVFPGDGTAITKSFY
jgi:hypothetical protein